MRQREKAEDYKDIISLSRPVSAAHPPMPLSDRAAQFLPFAALAGYESAIRETARQSQKRVEEEIIGIEWDKDPDGPS